MIKNLLTVLLILVILHAVCAVGLIGYGLATGRFSGEYMRQYIATWRGEKLAPPTEEVVVEKAKEDPRDAAARIVQGELEQEILTRDMLRQIELLRDLSATITLAQADLTKEREAFEQAKAAFEQRVAEVEQQAQDAGFQTALANYSRMNPRLVKDDFMQMTPDDAARYLRAMRPETSTAILERFRTDQEQARRVAIVRLLEQGEPYDATADVASNN